MKKLFFKIGKSLKQAGKWLIKTNTGRTVSGIILHSAWIGVNSTNPEMTGTNEYWAGHGLIGTITGVGIGGGAIKIKENLKNIIKKKETK